MPVAKAMLDLGPTWLDQYVRTVLSESMAIALEDAVVNGTGKDMPIGMMKDLAGAVVDGVYPDKKAMAI
ncbi:phage major capsid family protein, partial [Schaalia odontolytica]|uniref:phage major capsid family protein n=1 Tax=Schaalia odontolytica TaxID=1660 RepID=UPI00359C7B1F